MPRQVVDKILNQVLTGHTFLIQDIRECFGYYVRAMYPDLKFALASSVDLLGQNRIIIWVANEADIVLPFKYMQTWVEVRDAEYYPFERH